jgi:hypothetical protein
MTRFVTLVASVVGLWFSGTGYSQSFGTISFSPQRPTPNDSVTVILTPAEGQPDWCPFFFWFSASNVISIDALEDYQCIPGYGTTDQINIGKLPAGVYQVIWGFHDPPPNVTFPAATLTVTAALSEIPGLSFGGLFCLASCIGLIGLSWLRLSPHEP